MRVIFRIKPMLYKEIKEHCKKNEITVSEFLRDCARKELALIGKKI